MHDLWLHNDKSILYEFADVLSRVGVGNLRLFIRIHPDLFIVNIWELSNVDWHLSLPFAFQLQKWRLLVAFAIEDFVKTALLPLLRIVNRNSYMTRVSDCQLRWSL